TPSGSWKRARSAGTSISRWTFAFALIRRAYRNRRAATIGELLQVLDEGLRDCDRRGAPVGGLAPAAAVVGANSRSDRARRRASHPDPGCAPGTIGCGAGAGCANDMAMSPVTPPYRSGMATGLGVVLLAGAALAVGDVVHTSGGGRSVPPLLALWALIALP